MLLPRRQFIQQASLWAAGLGLTDLALLQRFQQALAQPTLRKLALLVGVDQYPWGMEPLKGCGTDVELVRELLIYRFGFNPRDILTLVDAEATRSNIEAAFTTHLLDQAQPEDIVVFQFSGYGCWVNPIPRSEAKTYNQQQVLLPFDAWLPNPRGGDAPLLNGIAEDTLFLLLRSLLSDQVTTILDCGFQPLGGLGCRSLRERAVLPVTLEELPSAEQTFQAKLLAQTQLTRDQVQVQRQSGQLPGLVLAAAGTKTAPVLEWDQPAFSAGLFSAALTQQLWNSTPAATLLLQFSRLSTQLTQQIGPSLQPQAQGQNRFGILPWRISPLSIPQTVGVVTLVDRRGQTAKVWLGGMPDSLLVAYQDQSYLRAFPAVRPPEAYAPATLVQLQSRRGRVAIAQHRSGPLLQAGQVLEEAVRVLPRRIVLRIALGTTLERIERVDAVSVVSLAKHSWQLVSTAQPADYVLTKLQPPPTDNAPASTGRRYRSTASYGLAYLGGALVPHTVGDRGEVIKLALGRLQPTFDGLLALKLLTLSLNQSALKVNATLEQVGTPPQPLLRVQSAGGVANTMTPEGTDALPKADKISTVLSLPSGTPLQYRVTNGESTPLYVLLIGFNGGTTAFVSVALESSTQTSTDKPSLKPLVVQPGGSIVIPAAAQIWKATAFAALNTTVLLYTHQPLTQTLTAIAAAVKTVPTTAAIGLAIISNPLAIVRQVLTDLHQASRPTVAGLGITDETLWVLDMQQWAALPLVYETV